MNKNLQYNFAMNFVMIIINIEAILSIRNHENHVRKDYSTILIISGMFLPFAY